MFTLLIPFNLFEELDGASCFRLIFSGLSALEFFFEVLEPSV